MNATKWICSAAMIGSGMLTGCAHKQALATTDTTSSTMASASPQPTQAPTQESSKANLETQKSEDLQALLDGAKIHFGFNEDLLTPDSETRLQSLAEKLRQYPDTKIVVSGNCDERGTEEYNLALGQRRADVAKAYLVNLGIDPSRIQTVSYGFERPADPAHNDAAWAANRRDDLQRQGS